jgi:hypothetical protein
LSRRLRLLIHKRGRLSILATFVLQKGAKEKFMRRLIFGLATFTILSSSSCIAAGNAGLIPIGPVHTVTLEPGVVRPGTALVVRTKDAVRTSKAYRTTVYFASVAEDILDQNGAVLIPRESAVELVVRSLPYLGPGGVGMTVLTLDVDAVTVSGVRYPLETDEEKPGAGGIGVDRGAAKEVGGDEVSSHVVTRGRRINVPAETLLAFQIQAPIRLRGYQR